MADPGSSSSLRRRRLRSEDIKSLQLFLVSYAPLCLALAVQHSDELCLRSSGCELRARAVFCWTTFACFVYGAMTAVVLVKNTRRKSAIPISYVSVSEEGNAVVAYLATYLLPFIGLDVRSWRAVATLLIYVIVLAVTFLRSDLGAINPTLYVLGYRTLSCVRSYTDGHSSLAYVIIKRDVPVEPSGTLTVHSYGRYHFAARKEHHADS